MRTSRIVSYESRPEYSTSSSDDDISIDLEEDELDERELDENVYAAATFSIVKDGWDITTLKDHDGIPWQDNLTRLLFTLTALLANYILQISLLYYTFYYVARPSVHRVQHTYAKYHVQCFEDDGTYNSTKWDMWSKDEQHELCSVVFAQHDKMLLIILFLWWCTILSEIRDNERLIKDFTSLPLTVHGHMIEQAEEDGNKIEKIRKLNTTMRLLLYITIALPKTMISIFLLIVGTVWLAATQSFADLILNAVALEFIIGIDETIFGSMFPASLKQDLKNSRVCPKKENHGHKIFNIVHWGFCRSLLYFGIIAGVLWLYLSPIGQAVPMIGVLPGYENDAACPIHWGELNTMRCDSFPDGKCFGKGPSADLFGEFNGSSGIKKRKRG